MKRLFGIFSRRAGEQDGRQGTSLMEALRDKYLTFQGLLAENNRVLELMAEMEEKLSGEYLFDKQFIHTRARAIADGVRSIIDSLNALSNNKYARLSHAYDAINKSVENALLLKPEIPQSEYAIPLDRLTKEMANIAGGKMAHLGEIRNLVGHPTPDGFSITAHTFKKFMEHNDIAGKVADAVAHLNIENLEELNSASERIRKLVVSAEVPGDIRQSVERAVFELKLRVNSPKLTVSVRSSALFEDGAFSFAGQYATFLNVPDDQVLLKYKEVLASLFTSRAIFYAKTKGFSEDEMVMAVGVLQMVDAKAAGVAYSRDPNEPAGNTVILNALRGLGKPVVDGTEDPHAFTVSRDTGCVVQSRAPEQKTMLVCAPEGDTEAVAVPDALRGAPCLTDDQIRTLCGYALGLENHYGSPQDVEWALGGDGRVYILQSRPLRMMRALETRGVPRRIEGRAALLEKGVIACKGIGYGRAFVLRDEDDLKDVPEGAVLVAHHTSTRFVTVMNRVSAIITDVGGATGHMASLAREYEIPAILDTERATALIRDGQELTVDAVNCNVYEGRVDRLLEHAVKKREPFRETHLFTMLENAVKFIVPLNLVDPDRENFTPEHCATFHDITRFVHEMAMAEIFKTGKGQDLDSFEDIMSAVTLAEEGEARRLGEQTSALKAGIPMDARLLDIDGGLRGNSRKVTADDILSIPLSAFLRGLKGMKWPEPRPTDVKGFLGMIAHTASIPEEQLRRTAAKSYALVSRHYMNFSIRLGYHFSMVEAYAGGNMNDNYIKFFFKGGGAAVDRRLRRVRLIRDIIKKMGFRVNVTEDVIDATLTKYRQAVIEEKLEAMGRLTVYTKQLDMVMYNEAVTDLFVEEFIAKHLAPGEA